MPRRTLVLLLAILLAHLSLLLYSSAKKSACYDEGPHLAAGLAYLRYNEMSIYNLSPPLLRMWAALPAYLAGADVPQARRYRSVDASSRHFDYFAEFQRLNRGQVHRYIQWGRLTMMPFSLLTAAGIFIWARRLWGDTAGLLACGVWCFSPTILAHANILGTDLPTAAAMFAACAAWTAFVRRPQPRWMLLASLAIALPHTMKFTALLLWPIALPIAAAEILAGRARWRQCALGFVAAAMVTFVLVNAAYRFRLMGDRLDSFTFESETMRRVQHILPAWMPVPFHRDMVRGFDAQKHEAEGVHVASLGEEGYFGGDWRYYPWLVLCKTTLGGLVLLALLAASFAMRRPTLDEAPLLIFLVGTAGGMIVTADINVGLRYLLPAYAPAAVLFGRCVVVGKMKPLALAAAVAIAIESVAATPRHLSFSNVVVTAARVHITNQDWGQSLIELRDWMNAHGQKRITLLHVGTIAPVEYGIDAAGAFDPVEGEYVAISRALLDGLPTKLLDRFVFVRPWRKLRRTQPVADLGGLLIYHTADVLDWQPQPWVVPIDNWQQAMQEPEMIRLRNFQQRAEKEF